MKKKMAKMAKKLRRSRNGEEEAEEVEMAKNTGLEGRKENEQFFF